MNSLPLTIQVKTDDSLRELTEHGSREYPFRFYLARVWDSDFHCVPWHWHQEVEFIFAQKGSVTVSAEGGKYILKQGSGMFIGSRVVHRFDAESENLVPNIVFSPTLLAPEGSLIFEKYIKPVLYRSCSICTLEPSVDWQKSVLELLQTVFSLQFEAEPDEMHTLRILLKIWELLYHNLPLSDANKNSSASSEQARLQIMMQFIQDHFREQLTLNDIAYCVSISPSRALQIFNKGIHCTPIAYLIDYRLQYSAYVLTSTETKISVIAQECGFQSSEYYCRAFRKLFHLTPTQYRLTRKVPSD